MANGSTSPAIKPDVSPLSPRHRLRRLDGRTREAQFVRRTEAELFEHLGGVERATVPQRILVQRIASDLLRLALFDDRIVRGEDISPHDGRIINALRNSVRLGLRELGLKGEAARGPSLAERLAAERAERERAAAPEAEAAD